MLLGRIKEDDEISYQGATLKNRTIECKEKTVQEALQDLSRLYDRMRERLAWSDKKLLRSIPICLPRNSDLVVRTCYAFSANSLLMDDDCEKDCSLAEVKEAMEHISTHFRLPLEAKRMIICFPPI